MDSISSDTPTVVYCFCQVADYYDDGSVQKFAACTVLSTIIYQLLSSENARPLLRSNERYAKLKRCIEDLSPQLPAKPSEQLPRLYSMLASLLTELALRKVFIVIDRIDRVQASLESFLAPLLDLIEEAQYVLKVFITIRTEYKFSDFMVGESVSSKKFSRLVFDQDS